MDEASVVTGRQPFTPDPSYPDPTESDLASPEFNAVWEAIKGWDIARHGDGMRAGATGNDVMHILLALRSGQQS